MTSSIVPYTPPGGAPAQSGGMGDFLNQFSSMMPALAGLFGNATATNPYDSQIQEMGKMEGRYDPYMNTGQDALKNYFSGLMGMANNPVGEYNDIMSQYQESPYYQYQRDEGINAANKAAAAGGYLGTPQEQLAIADRVGRMSSQDMGQYYQNIMQPKQFGLSGLGQLSNMGLQSLNGYQGYLGDMAGLRGAQSQWGNENSGSTLGGIGNLAQGAMSYLGGLF